MQIRQYSIEDRKGLANIQNPSWDTSFQQVSQIAFQLQLYQQKKLGKLLCWLAVFEGCPVPN